MTDRRRAADDAGALLLGRALSMIAEAAVMLVVVRLLGKAEVGVLAGMLVVCQTVAIVATAGLPALLLMALPGQPIEVRRAIASTHLRVLHTLGAVVGVGFVAFALAGEHRGAAPEDTAVWLWLAPLPLFDLPLRALPNLLVIEGRAATGARLAIGKSIVSSAATLVPVALGAPLWGVAACGTLGAAVVWLALPWSLAQLYRGVERPATTAGEPGPITSSGWPSGWTTLRRALPLGLTDIAGAIAARLDRHLVLAWFSVEAFAEYQVGAWQIPFIVNIPYAVGTATAAPMRELFSAGRGRAAVELWRASIHDVALVVVPVSMVFLVAAPSVVELLFTARYLPAVPVFRCYTVLTMARVAAFGVVLVAAGRPRDVLLAASFGLAASVAIALPLTAWLGPTGAAIAAVIAFVPAAGVYCWRIARAAGVALGRTFPLGTYARLVSWAAIPGAVAAALDHVFDPSPLRGLIVTTAVVGVGFAALATRAGDLDRDHWRYLARWLSLRPLRDRAVDRR